MNMNSLTAIKEEKYTELESSSSGLNYSDRPAV